MPATVVLRTCAPTQSWGAMGNLADNRPTDPQPMHSSITGLLCRAAGIAEDDAPNVARVSDSVQAVRVDHQGHITSDYQSIANTVDTNMKPRGMIISRRGEIQDGCFTVFRQYDDTALATELNSALADPADVLWFGRRCHLAPWPLHASVVNKPIDDTLIGAWPHCPVHPGHDPTWDLVEDTTAPLNQPGVTLTGCVAVSLQPRRYRVTALRRRQIPRLPERTADPGPRLGITGDGIVVELDQEIR